MQGCVEEAEERPTVKACWLTTKCPQWCEGLHSSQRWAADRDLSKSAIHRCAMQIMTAKGPTSNAQAH